MCKSPQLPFVIYYNVFKSYIFSFKLLSAALTTNLCAFTRLFLFIISQALRIFSFYAEQYGTVNNTYARTQLCINI